MSTKENVNRIATNPHRSWMAGAFFLKKASTIKRLTQYNRFAKSLFSAVITAFLLSISTSASADPVSVTLTYQCTYPLIGTQPMSVIVNSDMPQTLNVGESTGAFDLDAVATAQGNTWVGLNIVSATSIEGSVASQANLSGTNLSLDLNVPLVLESQPIPPTNGDFDLIAAGQTPPLTFSEQNLGTVTITVGNIDLALLARKADGSPVIFAESDPATGIFPAPCILDAGQDNVLHSFEVVQNDPDPLPEISVTPSALNFGDAQSGLTESLDVTVSNIGGANLLISALNITGADSSEFFQTNNCSTVIPNDTCTVTIMFSPSGEGSRAATLTIDSNDADNATVSIPLSGNGVLAPEPNIALSATQLNFGEVQAGVTEELAVTVNNTGSAALLISGNISLSGTDASEFFQTNDCNNVAIGESCTITVSLTPSGAGVRSATLFITSNDPDNATVTVSLLGEGALAPQPEILIAPTSLVFGDVTTGSDALLIATISNNGTANLNISTIFIDGTNASEFSQSNSCAAIIPNATCQVSVTFTPSGDGSRTASLTIASDDPDSPTLKVPLTGTATLIPEPKITVAPTSINIGTVQITGSANRIITVTSSGTGPLSVSNVALSGTNATEFSQSHNCTTVTAGESCSISLTFTPASVGSKSALLTIASDDASTPSVAVSISAEGTDQPLPNIVVAPPTFTFANTQVGASTQVLLAIANTGSAQLDVGSISIGGTNSASFSQTNDCSSLAVFSICNLTATFSPTVEGVNVATLTITSNDPDTPSYEISLSGSGLAIPKPTISASPSAINFGSTLLDDTESRTVTIENIGSQPLAVTLSLSGMGASSFFQMSDGNCSAMAASATCTVTVNFSPTVAGNHVAALELASNDPDTPTLQIPLSGTGEEDQTPDISVSPTTLPFGDVEIGSSADLTTVITNNGVGDLSISDISISGANASDYSTAHSCTTIAAGNSCSVTVTLAPTVEGARSATLTITSDDPDTASVDVALSGSGTAAPAPQISLDNMSLSFAQTVVGQSSPLSLTVTNNGNAALVISDVALSGTHAASFSQSHNCATVAAGMSCVISTSFIPVTIGAKNAVITVTSNDPTNGTVVIPVSGTAIPVPVANISLSTTNLDFGQRQIGTNLDLNVTVNNTGTAALTISNVGLSGAASFSENNNCSTVAINAACTVTVTFAPSAVASDNATLTLSSNDPDAASVTVSITGQGVPIPVPAVFASEVDFDGVVINETRQRDVTIENTGTANLIITGVAVQGTDSSSYTIVGNCNVTLSPSQNCVLTMTYAPTEVGASNAALVLESNDPTNPTYSVTLSGEGLALPVPGLTLSVDKLEFDEINPGNAKRMVLIAENTGSTTLNLTTALSGADRGSYFPFKNSQCTGLAPGNTCEISVSFAPATPGEKLATLVVSSEAAPINVALIGSGIGFTSPPPPPEENTSDAKSYGEEPTGVGNFGGVMFLLVTLLVIRLAGRRNLHTPR